MNVTKQTAIEAATWAAERENVCTVVYYSGNNLDGWKWDYAYFIDWHDASWREVRPLIITGYVKKEGA